MEELLEQASDHKMVLRTDNLVKRYGKRTVVNHVSFDVKQGEIVGLLGPNGAGKTTSFYMTTGLITPNEGHIYLDDQDITDYPVYKRARAGVGYLAQEASVFRKMSVEDNIASVLELTGRPLDYQREKLESLISEFRLQKVRKNLGDRLSGGERRRTEIARCLAIEPKFIMLDEPFAGVDPIAVEDIQQIVWKLKDRNIGILITDHNVHETLSITDRAYLLFEGRILFQGTPEELAVNPLMFATSGQAVPIRRLPGQKLPDNYYRTERDNPAVWAPERSYAYTRGAAPGDYAINDTPRKGNLTYPLILVQFPDLQFSFNDRESLMSYYEDLYNGNGCTDTVGFEFWENRYYRTTPSVSDYFRDQSYGQYVPKFEIIGPIIAPTLRNLYLRYAIQS